MTIPKVDAYPLPAETELPPSRVEWRVDATRAVLLVHDLQDYFLNFYGDHSPLVEQLLHNVSRLRRACKGAGIPIVYTAQPHEQSAEQRGLLTEMWGPGITAWPGLWRIAEAVGPDADDTVFTKWRYSAFSRTQLESWLHETGRDQLLICGVYAHIGCQATACDAFMADVQPFLIADAVADFSRRHHDGAMSYVAGCCGVVASCKQVLEVLASERGGVAAGAVLRRQVCELLGLRDEAVGDDDNLLERGLDSVRLMTLIERIDALGIPLDFAQLAERPTLSAWYQLVGRQ